MADVNCETMEDGQSKVVIYLSPNEVDLMITAWHMPLEFKHALLDAKNVALRLSENSGGGNAS